MNQLHRRRFLVSLILSGVLIGSCAAPLGKMPIPSATEETPTVTLSSITFTEAKKFPTLTPRMLTVTPTVDKQASSRQMLAYLSAQGSLGELSTIRADGSRRAILLREEMLIADLVSSPDSKQIAFWGCPGSMISNCYSTGDQDILVIDWDGGDLRHLTGSPGHDRDPDWSPDGRIAFISDRSGSEQIYIMNSDGSDPRQLTDQPIQNMDPKWSPDGKWIAYTNLLAGKHRIYVISPDGKPAGDPIVGDAPAWSPVSLAGGLRLAFVCSQGQNHDICTVKPDGSDRVNLTNTLFDERCPDWSPDGSWLAFDAGPGGKRFIGKVCTNCPSGGEAIRITSASTPSGCPVWSPDGWQIAYMNNFDLRIVNADGSGATKLASGVHFGPIWRP